MKHPIRAACAAILILFSLILLPLSDSQADPDISVTDGSAWAWSWADIRWDGFPDPADMRVTLSNDAKITFYYDQMKDTPDVRSKTRGGGLTEDDLRLDESSVYAAVGAEAATPACEDDHGCGNDHDGYDHDGYKHDGYAHGRGKDRGGKDHDGYDRGGEDRDGDDLDGTDLDGCGCDGKSHGHGKGYQPSKARIEGVASRLLPFSVNKPTTVTFTLEYSLSAGEGTRNDKDKSRAVTKVAMQAKSGRSGWVKDKQIMKGAGQEHGFLSVELSLTKKKGLNGVLQVSAEGSARAMSKKKGDDCDGGEVCGDGTECRNQCVTLELDGEGVDFDGDSLVDLAFVSSDIDNDFDGIYGPYLATVGNDACAGYASDSRITPPLDPSVDFCEISQAVDYIPASGGYGDYFSYVNPVKDDAMIVMAQDGSTFYKIEIYELDDTSISFYYKEIAFPGCFTCDPGLGGFIDCYAQ